MKRWLIPATVLASLVALPAVAQADVRVGGRDRKEMPERKGILFGIGASAGATVVQRGFVPRMGFRTEIGGGITDRITLGVDLGLVGHQGIKKGIGATVDVVATGFLAPSFGVRLGAGATSIAPARAQQEKLPGFGGIVGLVYEFRVMEHMAFALTADFDGRLRTDGLPARAFVLSFRMRGYFRGKK